MARSADTTVPKPKAEPPKVEVASKFIDNNIDRVTDRLPRGRGIFVSKRLQLRIAATQPLVNL